MDPFRPYLAAFAARFQLTLQYRTAAIAGFGTQCWWGVIKIMVLAAFFAGQTDYRRRERQVSRMTGNASDN